MPVLFRLFVRAPFTDDDAAQKDVTVFVHLLAVFRGEDGHALDAVHRGKAQNVGDGIDAARTRIEGADFRLGDEQNFRRESVPLPQPLHCRGKPFKPRGGEVGIEHDHLSCTSSFIACRSRLKRMAGYSTR